jgi:hydrogenase-4 component F
MPSLLVLAIIAVPLLIAGLAALWPQERTRPLLLPLGGLLHLGLTLAAIFAREARPPGPEAWLHLDALGAVTLLALAVQALLLGLYAPGYLRLRPERRNRSLVVCIGLMQGLASLAVLSQHLVLTWVAIEGATLSLVPTLYFSHGSRSLEATWKYLMVGGVGIAFALLGTFFMAYAAVVTGHEVGLTFTALREAGAQLSPAWVRAAFVLLLVGYGTKMGLAPMHAWKPDAYGEAPGLVGALLAGGMTSVAFAVLARMTGLVEQLGQAGLVRPALLALGGLSMAWAAVFMVRQTDLKRLLAWSSIEHMGILATGLGLGPLALPATLLHLLGNAWIKTSLFCAIGNLHRAFGSKQIPIVSGALSRLPVSAVLVVGGFLLATGLPPGPLFLSELGLLAVAVEGGSWWVVGSMLLCLLVVFLGFSASIIAATLGEPVSGPSTYRDSTATTLAPIAALLLAIALGCWVPGPLRALFAEVATSYGNGLP